MVLRIGDISELITDTGLLMITQQKASEVTDIVERVVGWPKLWDLALDHGPKYINGLKKLGGSDYISTSCSDCMPSVQGEEHSKRLSHLSCSQYSFKEHMYVAAMNSYHYFFSY